MAYRVEHEADTGRSRTPVTGGAIVGDRLLRGRLLDLEGGHRDGRRAVGTGNGGGVVPAVGKLDVDHVRTGGQVVDRIEGVLDIRGREDQLGIVVRGDWCRLRT